MVVRSVLNTILVLWCLGLPVGAILLRENTIWAYSQERLNLSCPEPVGESGLEKAVWSVNNSAAGVLQREGVKGEQLSIAAQDVGDRSSLRCLRGDKELVSYSLRIVGLYDLPPVPVLRTPLDLLPGNSHQLDCRVQEDTVVEFTWYHNHQRILPASTTVVIFSSSSASSLTILSPDKTSGGTYYCTAKITNGASARSNQVRLVLIVFAPWTVQETAVGTARSHDFLPSLPYTCSTPAVVTWVDEGYRRINESRKMVIEDRGHLYVFVPFWKGAVLRNYARSIHDTEEKLKHWISTYRVPDEDEGLIRRDPLEAQFIVVPVNKTVWENEAESVSFPCFANGRPPFQFQWYRNTPVPLRASRRYVFAEDNVRFTILQPTVSDSGLYTCRAVNEHQTLSQTVALTVLAPPAIIPPNASIVVSAGDPAILRLTITSSPTTRRIRWQRNGEDISNWSGLSAGADMIHIHNMSREYNGLYQLTVEDGERSTIASYAILATYSAPRVTVFTDKVEANYGESISLPCGHTGAPMPNVTWLKNGQVLPKGEKVSYSRDGLLQLTSLHRNDSGVYTCLLTNSEGVSRRNCTVIVNDVPPTITSMTDAVEVAIGQEIKLECKYIGVPAPTLIWYKDGRKLEPNQTFQSRGTLYIDPARKDDSGTYRCLVVSETGMDTKNCTVVVYGDIGIEHSKWLQLSGLGNPAVLSCSSDLPQAQWSWFRDGAPLNRSALSQPENNELSIYSIGGSSSSVYECVARNKIGIASGRTIVFAQGTPSPPLNPQVVDVQHRSVSLMWDTPLYTGDAGEVWYQVEYRASGEDWKPAGTTVGEQQVQVADLSPGQLYEFRVTAANTVGAGEVAQLPLQVRTAICERPKEIVEDLQFRRVGPGFVEVVWKAITKAASPDCYLGNYVVFYSYASTDSRLQGTMHIRVPGLVSSAANLTDLLPDLVLQVWVAVYNEYGLGEMSPRLEVRTAIQAPRAAPSNVTFQRPTDTSIVLNFVPPEWPLNGGAVTHYVVLFTPRSYSDSPHEVMIQHNRSLAIQSAQFRVEPSTEYIVRVAGVSASGRGPFTPAFYIDLSGQGGSFPGYFYATDVTTTSIQLGWEMENVSGSSILISCSRTNDSSPAVEIDVPKHVGRFLVKDLVQGASYNITWRMNTHAPSRMSPSIILSTESGPYSSLVPFSALLFKRTATSVALYWDRRLTSSSLTLYASGPGGTSQSMEVKDLPSMPLTVGNLQPMTTYTFFVIPNDGESQGLTIPLAQTTMLDPVCLGPVDVLATPFVHSILLTWEVPHACRIAETFHWKLMFSHLEIESTPTAIVLPFSSQSSALLTPLAPSSPYDITVTCETMIGVCPSPVMLIVTTLPAVELPSPPNVTIASVTHNSAVLSWPPLSNVHYPSPRGYTVFVKTTNGQADRVVLLGLSDRTVDKLEPDTSYTVSVSVTTPGREGPRSTPVSFITELARPEVLRVVMRDTEFSTSKWSIALYPGLTGLVTKLGITENVLPAYFRQLLIPSQVLSQKLVQFSVQAVYSSRRSAPSTCFIGTSFYADTGYPLSNVSVTNISASSAVLTWTLRQSLYNQHYVHIKIDSLRDARIIHRVNPYACSFLLMDLNPNTQYTLQTSADSCSGSYTWRGQISFTTGIAAPSDSPKNVVIDSASSASLIVGWKPSSFLSYNGELLGYRVNYSTGNASVTISISDPKKLFAVIPVNSATVESVSVCLYNSAGNGPWSQKLKLGHILRRSPSVLEQLSSLAVGRSSAVVSWSLPRLLPIHQISHIKLNLTTAVSFNDGPDLIFNHWRTSGAATYPLALLRELVARSSSPVGSPASLDEVSKTSENALDSQGDSIISAWGESVTTQRPVHPSASPMIVYLSPFVTSYSFWNLEALTGYTLSVTVVMVSGEESPAATLNFTTKDEELGAPAPVVLVEPLTHRRLNASWVLSSSRGAPRLIELCLEDVEILETVCTFLLGNKTSHVFRDLKETTQYKVSVRPVDGPYSRVGEASALLGLAPETPDPPRNLSASTDRTTVTLQWLPGEENRRPLLAYAVQFYSLDRVQVSTQLIPMWNITGSTIKSCLMHHNLSAGSFIASLFAINKKGWSRPVSVTLTVPGGPMIPLLISIGVVVVFVLLVALILLGRRFQLNKDNKKLANPESTKLILRGESKPEDVTVSLKLRGSEEERAAVSENPNIYDTSGHPTASIQSRGTIDRRILRSQMQDHRRGDNYQTIRSFKLDLSEPDQPNAISSFGTVLPLDEPSSPLPTGDSISLRRFSEVAIADDVHDPEESSRAPLLSYPWSAPNGVRSSALLWQDGVHADVDDMHSTFV